MSTTYRGMRTRLVHAGEPRPRLEGAVTLPVFQSSTYESRGGDYHHDVRYIRLNNTPNHTALADKLCAVEECEAALVTGSGMAAISAALLAVLRSGDHILAQETLYGGTHTLMHDEFPKLGIRCDVVDTRRPETWEAALRPETKVFYVESMSNPVLRVPDLRAVVEFARSHDLITMIDNTFATPVNYRPCPRGFDLTLHSATKYLNGHTDIVAGVVAGRGDLVEKTHLMLNHLGGSLDPHACFLLQRGLKTLSLRVRQQNENALTLARALEGHAAVERVHYPGLESSPEHARAGAAFDGFGGMVAFEPAGGVRAAEAFFDRVRIPIVGPSLGGVETLVTRPATTSHAGMDPLERERQGIGEALVRVSVGIEDADELIDDFNAALSG